MLPLALTIFLFIVLANWMELIPGMESVGLISEVLPAAAAGLVSVARLFAGLLVIVQP